ncbi:hypothetical protein [Tsukamurella sp. 1534]|uniref:hypothetical protein n=1 Tax=Tsukamurella sp. 1534 TaxID=1151061 RepID=UPI0006ACF3E2|nr:hypothetical protein [Tsukamurella sp. 1534]
MNATKDTGSSSSGLSDTAKTWLHRAIAVFVIIAIGIGAYFALSAFVPRWWAQTVGHMVGRQMWGGVSLGLTIGFFGTAIPVFLLVFAAKRVKKHPAVAVISGLLAIAAAVPNLMTLGIVVGTGLGAKAGRVVMDVESPGFRGASLIGAIAGLVIAIAIMAYLGVNRRKRAKAKAAKAVGAGSPKSATTSSPDQTPAPHTDGTS